MLRLDCTFGCVGDLIGCEIGWVGFWLGILAVGIKICLCRAGMAFWLVVDLVLLKIWQGWRFGWVGDFNGLGCTAMVVRFVWIFLGWEDLALLQFNNRLDSGLAWAGFMFGLGI